MIFTPYAVPVFVSAAVHFALALYALRRREVPAAVPFGLAMILASAWAWSYALDLSFPSLSDKLFLARSRFIFISFLLPCWLMMALQHSGRGHWLNRPRLGALLVVPAITSLLSLTLHPLFRYDFELREMGILLLLVARFGPWYLVHVAYSYALVLWATAVLALSLRRHAPPFYRRQTWLIIGAGLLPTLADSVFQTPFNPVPGYNLATTVFMFTGLMVAWALFRHRFLDLAPVAREKVFEAMRDVVIVLDPDGRIVDLNLAAREILGSHYVRAEGKKAETVFKAWPDLVGLCLGAAPGEGQLSLGHGSGQRHYEVQGLPLTDRKGRDIGRLMTLHDATERFRAQAREMERQRAVALLESRDRLAQEIAELLHGPVQTKLLVAWQRLSDCQDFLKTDPTLVQRSLKEVSQMIDDVREQEVRQASHRLHPSMISVGLVPAVESLVDGLGGSPRLRLEIDPQVRRLDDPARHLIPGPVRLAAYHIVEEALANARRHANASAVNVSLGIDEVRRLAIKVEDDGCGFDVAESKRGLGLIIIGGRAEQAGGTWQISSIPGRGTAVSALLPLG